MQPHATSIRIPTGLKENYTGLLRMSPRPYLSFFPYNAIQSHLEKRSGKHILKLIFTKIE